MAMTPLPAAPQRDQDPATFATTADTFVAALPGFVTEANALEAAVDADATTATTQAGIATTQAGIATTQASNALASANAADVSEANALASANAAALSESNAATSEANAASSATALTATSTTSNTIGTGSKVFTVQTGKQFVAGQYVQAISGSNWMFGIVTSYVTDQLTINVTDTNGSGTFASWAIAVSGIKGIQGPVGIASIGYSARTSDTQLVAADAAYLIDITSGTFTQTFAAAASLGSGWHVYIRNSGTGDITLDPNGAETIDGLTSFIMYPSEVRLVQCDGTSFRSIVLNAFKKTITASDNFIKPPGYSQFEGLAWSAGSSGQKSGSVSVSSSGGSGGACFKFSFNSNDITTTTAVTIGAGGAAVTTNSGGNNGGNTSFGSLLTVFSGADYLTGGSVGVTSSFNSTSPNGFEGHSTSGTPRDTIYGGTCASSTGSAVSSSSVYGAGAGGSLSSSAVLRAAGISKFGGNGGAASSTGNGSNGIAPGGGGGATQTGAQSGAGARGEVRIWGVV